MKAIGIPSRGIGARLGGAFAVLLLMLLACVGIGEWQLGALSGAVSSVARSAEASRRAVTLVAQAQETAAALGRAVMADNVDVMQANLKQVSVVAADMQEGAKALAELDHGDAGALQAVQAAEGPFRKTMGQVAEAIKGGDTDAARLKLNEKDTLVAGANYLAALNRLADAKRQLSDTARQQAAEAHSHGRNLLAGVGILGALLAALMGWWMTRSVIRQVGGEPQDAAQVARAVAAGDLASAVHVRAGDEASVIAAMRAMQLSLARVVAQVRGNSESVASSSARIAQGNADLSQRTEQQASALEQTSATMHQLGATVKGNADSARQANQLAKEASGVAQGGGAVVGEVVQMMKGINDSSRRIAEIIGTIDGIAFQTNILALNAAVEAARAGDQGRGFAVVAGEVRSLAHRSADAAREIKSLITASVEQVEQGTLLVDKAGATMSDVVASIGRVSDIVGEISAASTEQAEGVARVAEAIGRMDQMTQQNAALVEQSAAVAESLTGQAQSLVQTVAVFRLGEAA